MFSVSKQQTIGEGSVKAAPLLLFLILMILCVKGFSFTLPGKDTTKNKFELNDPRNPDCPCHKHQQQAENEYKQLQNQVNFTNVNKFENDKNSDNQQGGNEMNGFGFEKIKFNSGKFSFSGSKRTRNSGKETAGDKKVKTNGIFRENYSFRVVKMKFPSAKSRNVKHRKMKGCFSDKLSRCFHF